MSKIAQQYRVTWEDNPTDLEDLNRKLAYQLNHIDEMFQALFDNTTDVNDGEDGSDGTPGADGDELETGSWTPTDASGAGLSFSNVDGEYFKIGALVILTGALTFPATADANPVLIGGLPFTPIDQTGQNNRYGGSVISSSEASAFKCFMPAAGTGVRFLDSADGSILNSTFTTNYINFIVIYRTDD